MNEEIPHQNTWPSPVTGTSHLSFKQPAAKTADLKTGGDFAAIC